MRQYLRVAFVLAGSLVLIYLLNEYNNRLAAEVQVEAQVYPEEEVVETFQQAPPTVSVELQEPKVIQQPQQPVPLLPGTIDPQENGAVVPTNDGETDQRVRATRELPQDCFPKDQLRPSELLPADANSRWAQVNPAGQGELKDVNFLEAGYHLGVNTVGQSLRNANRQLRSEPPNPQVKVSPWHQTTIEPDVSRRPLE